MKRQTSRLFAGFASVVITFALFQGIAVYGAAGGQAGDTGGQMMAAISANADSGTR